jgi:hypothetical protein
LFFLAADFFIAREGSGSMKVSWRLGLRATTCFEDEVESRAWIATAEAERGERERAARMEKTAKTLERGLSVTIMAD